MNAFTASFGPVYMLSAPSIGNCQTCLSMNLKPGTKYTLTYFADADRKSSDDFKLRAETLPLHANIKPS